MAIFQLPCAHGTALNSILKVDDGPGNLGVLGEDAFEQTASAGILIVLILLDNVGLLLLHSLMLLHCLAGKKKFGAVEENGSYATDLK